MYESKKIYTGRDSKKEIDRAEPHYRRQAKNSYAADLWEFPIDHLLLNVYGGNSKRL